MIVLGFTDEEVKAQTTSRVQVVCIQSQLHWDLLVPSAYIF